MFFSVIVPIYNAETTLDRCLNSLVTQIFTDFEVIMVDDGSTDASKKICLVYESKDPRFHFYRKKNGGVSSARNLGIKVAQANYITFLDSDDTYCDDYLLSFRDVINRFPGRDNYWCGFRYISDVIEPTNKVTRYQSDDNIIISSRNSIMTLHEMELVASPVNKVYSRQVLVGNEVFMREDLSLGEDLLFNFMYLDCNKDTEVVIVNRALYNYFCFSEESLNHKYRKNLKQIYVILMEEMKRYLCKWDIDDSQMKLYYNAAFYMYDACMRNTFHKKNTDSFFRKLSENNNTMKDNGYQEVLRKASPSVNQLYLKILKSKNYIWVLLLNWGIEIRNKWLK